MTSKDEQQAGACLKKQAVSKSAGGGQMDRTEEKLLVFSDMVLKDAARQKQELLDKARATSRERIEADELRLLQEAHDEIQEALRTMGRASNEEISRTILESKQALFTRRQEIVDAVFSRVAVRLEAFRQSPEYRGFLQERMAEGFRVLGEGDIRVEVDEQDVPLANEVARSLGKACRVDVSEEELGGGCLFINRTTGRMQNDSFARRLDMERVSFLERYELRLDG